MGRGHSTSDCGTDPASFLDHFKHWFHSFLFVTNFLIRVTEKSQRQTPGAATDKVYSNRHLHTSRLLGLPYVVDMCRRILAGLCRNNLLGLVYVMNSPALPPTSTSNQRANLCVKRSSASCRPESHNNCNRRSSQAFSTAVCVQMFRNNRVSWNAVRR